MKLITEEMHQDFRIARIEKKYRREIADAYYEDCKDRESIPCFSDWLNLYIAENCEPYSINLNVFFRPKKEKVNFTKKV